MRALGSAASPTRRPSMSHPLRGEGSSAHSSTSAGRNWRDCCEPRTQQESAVSLRQWERELACVRTWSSHSVALSTEALATSKKAVVGLLPSKPMLCSGVAGRSPQANPPASPLGIGGSSLHQQSAMAACLIPHAAWQQSAVLSAATVPTAGQPERSSLHPSAGVSQFA